MHRYLMLALACCLCFTVSAHAQPQKVNGELKIEIIKLFNDPAVTAFVANNGDDPVALNWYANILKLAETPDARFFLAVDAMLTIMNNGNQLFESLFEDKEINMDTPQNFIELDEDKGPNGYGYKLKYYATANDNDGSVWGLFGYGQYSKYSWFEKNRIYRLYKGVLYNITPDYPQEADFYADGLPEYPADPYVERQFIYEKGLAKCEMYVTFAVDTQTAPYKIKAVLKQENDAGYAPDFQPAYECTPQCVIEYAWDGTRYVRVGRICSADGDWGVSVPAILHEQPQKANAELKAEIIKLFNDQAVAAFVANNGDDPVALNWYANILKLAETPDARFFMAADTLLNVMNNGQQLIEGLFENKEFNMDTPRNFIELDEYSGGTLGYGYNIKSYATADTNDGSVWGLLIDGQYTKYSWFEKDRIYRFYQGVLYDITPAYPQEADFYTDGLPEYPADPYAERQFIYEEGLDKCKMYVTFAVDTQTAPYKIKAVLKQENDAGYAPYFQPAYECTPQCVIEYVWDGIGYARGEKICRADGGWGVTVPAIPDEEDAY